MILIVTFSSTEATDSTPSIGAVSPSLSTLASNIDSSILSHSPAVQGLFLALSKAARPCFTDNRFLVSVAHEFRLKEPLVKVILICTLTIKCVGCRALSADQLKIKGVGGCAGCADNTYQHEPNLVIMAGKSNHPSHFTSKVG
jgi:hypothetical protein